MVVQHLCFWSEQHWLQAFFGFHSSLAVISASSAASLPLSMVGALAFELLDGSSPVFPAASIHSCPFLVKVC